MTFFSPSRFYAKQMACSNRILAVKQGKLYRMKNEQLLIVYPIKDGVRIWMLLTFVESEKKEFQIQDLVEYPWRLIDPFFFFNSATEIKIQYDVRNLTQYLI